MKKSLVLLLLVAAACAKTPAEPALPTAPSRTVGWRVDNRDLSADHWVTGFDPPATRVVYGREYVDGRIVSEVRLHFPAAVGSYPLGAGSPAWASYARDGVTYYAGAAPGASAPTGSGTLVLTAEQDGVAVGTFTFTGVDPASQAEKTVTHGTFRVPI
jgi:hypothetical protein